MSASIEGMPIDGRFNITVASKTNAWYGEQGAPSEVITQSRVVKHLELENDAERDFFAALHDGDLFTVEVRRWHHPPGRRCLWGYRDRALLQTVRQGLMRLCASALLIFVDHLVDQAAGHCAREVLIRAGDWLHEHPCAPRLQVGSPDDRHEIVLTVPDVALVK